MWSDRGRMIAGAVYALISSIGYSTNSISMRRAMLRGKASDGVYVTVLAGLPLFALGALLSGQLFRIFDFSAERYIALISAGVLHYIVGRYCNYRAIQAIGANRSRPFMQTIILFTLGIAIIFLDEEVTRMMWVGIALIMIGPVVSIKGPRFRKAPGNDGAVAGGANGGPSASSASVATAKPVKAVDELPARKLAEGYIFASLNAVVWGTTPVLIRYGVGGTDLGIVGGLVAYLAAGLLLMPALLSQALRESLGSISGSTARWLGAATLAITVGVMFRYLALAAAPVTVVAPVMRATGFVQLPLTYLINRHIESFEPRLVAGIVVSIIGGFVIVLG